MTKFTPGPWTFNQRQGTVFAKQEPICQFNGDFTQNIKQNANLIASAPEMFELLEEISQDCDHVLAFKIEKLMKKIDESYGET